MGYVIAAYAVTLGTAAVYLLRLARERRSLVRELGSESACEHPSSPAGASPS